MLSRRRGKGGKSNHLRGNGGTPVNGLPWGETHKEGELRQGGKSTEREKKSKKR